MRISSQVLELDLCIDTNADKNCATLMARPQYGWHKEVRLINMPKLSLSDEVVGSQGLQGLE